MADQIRLAEGFDPASTQEWRELVAAVVNKARPEDRQLTPEQAEETLPGADAWALGEALARGKAVRLSLDQTMVADESAPLADGAEVAFFPPVTGG